MRIVTYRMLLTLEVDPSRVLRSPGGGPLDDLTIVGAPDQGNVGGPMAVRARGRHLDSNDNDPAGGGRQRVWRR